MGAPGVGSPFALEGCLAQVGLATLLAVFELERRSGMIALRQDPGEGGAAGEVVIRDGRPLCALVHASPRRRGRDALYDLLGWRQGRFAFTSGRVEVADQLRSSATHLLLEAARRVDEHQQPWRG